MSIEAMKQALEALKGNCTNPVADPEQAAAEDKAITALRQAIEQAEKQEPVAWIKVSDELPKCGKPVLGCYKDTYEKLWIVRAKWIPKHTEESYGDDDFFVEYDEATDTYYLPEGWYECINNWDDYSSVKIYEGEITHWMMLPTAPDQNYAAPPRKEWVGLTVDEIVEISESDENTGDVWMALNVQAKLKERNT